MLNLLNILAVVYVSLAPGMNVGRLLHAADLCRYIQTQTEVHVANAQGCPCNHEKQEQAPEKDCPHLQNLPIDSGGMPAVQLTSTIELPNPALCFIVDSYVEPATATVTGTDDPRPPPGPPLVGTTILLV